MRYAQIIRGIGFFAVVILHEQFSILTS